MTGKPEVISSLVRVVPTNALVLTGLEGFRPLQLSRRFAIRAARFGPEADFSLNAR